MNYDGGRRDKVQGTYSVSVSVLVLLTVLCAVFWRVCS